MITLQLPWACCSLLLGLLSACTRGVDSPDPRLVAMRKAITEVTSNAWQTVSGCPGAVGSLSLSYEDLQLLSAALQRYTDDEILSFVEWPIISDLNDLKAEIARNLELRLCEIEELRANRDLSADKDELISDEYDSLLESKNDISRNESIKESDLDSDFFIEYKPNLEDSRVLISSDAFLFLLNLIYCDADKDSIKRYSNVIRSQIKKQINRSDFIITNL
jgi:hypothetical protein